MLAAHSIKKKISNNAFVLAKIAQTAKENGKNIINGTLGVLYSDEDSFYTFKTVTNELLLLKETDIFPYSESIDGNSLFKKAVMKYLFPNSSFSEKLFYEVIATPGGTGAISNTFSNYLNPNETVLLPEYMWDSYKIMAIENKGYYETYTLFNSKNEFDIENFKELVFKYAKIQNNLIIILNNPCQNPTGYKFTSQEIKEIMVILKEACNLTNIILLNDIAYIDFDNQDFSLNLFLENLPENLLIVFAFSISKGLSSYGLRVGAQIAFSSLEKNIKDFYDASIFTCRSSWSNVNNSGLKIFSNIVLNDKKLKNLKDEQNYIKNILNKRAEIFINEAQKIQLNFLPYKSGFFISIPFNPSMREKIENYFIKNNIYFLVFNNYIRVAICSIPTHKIYGIAKKIKEAITD